MFLCLDEQFESLFIGRSRQAWGRAAEWFDYGPCV